MISTGRQGTDDRPAASSGHRRRRDRNPRSKQVFVRLSTDEYDELAAAAAQADLTTTGYVAEAALASARSQTTTPGQADSPGVTRTELAQLQRELFAARTALGKVGGNLNQAVTVLHSIGRPPAWLEDAVIIYPPLKGPEFDPYDVEEGTRSMRSWIRTCERPRQRFSR